MGERLEPSSSQTPTPSGQRAGPPFWLVQLSRHGPLSPMAWISQESHVQVFVASHTHFSYLEARKNA